MKSAEIDIENLEGNRFEIHLRIFDFEKSGKPVYEKADVVDTLKIISPVQEEIDWEKQVTLTKGKEKTK